MPTSPRKKSRIPKFKTLEEEAEFWDTHDSTEFEDEFEEVEITFARPLIHVLEVELDARTLGRLIEMSRQKGVRVSDLVQGWLKDRLQKEESEATSTTS